MFTLPLMAISMIVARVMQGMGYGLPGLVINTVRVFIVAIPLAYVFVLMLGYGYLSIAVAIVIGGIAAAVLAVGWLLVKLARLENANAALHVP